jgi:ATP-dependent Clp protease protease subunit
MTQDDVIDLIEAYDLAKEKYNKPKGKQASMPDMMFSGLNKSEFKEKIVPSSFFILMQDIDESCKDVIQWILESNFSEDRPQVLNLIINSAGGELSSAFAVIDVMRGSQIPVRTVGVGQIASAGLMIFMAGKKGSRILTPNTSIMSHRFSGGSWGKSHELVAIAKEFDLTSTRIMEHYKKCTGLKEAEILKHLLPPQDIWLSAKEALKLGVCDKVSELN